MLTPPPATSTSRKADRDSPLQAALKCAHRLMEQRIISNPKDMMAVLLFGTEKTRFQADANSRSALGYPHCYLFTDLDIPSAEDVKALRSLADEGEEHGGVLEPAADGVSLSSVLFCANQIFTTRAANFGSRRLFIITDDDDPHAADKAATSAAAVRAKDLYDLGVTIDLFPITRGDASFDLSKFYDVSSAPLAAGRGAMRDGTLTRPAQDIIYHDPLAEANSSATPVSRSGGGLSLLASLTSNINSKQTPKRALFSNLPLEIAPGLRISVKGYNVLHRQTLARTCYIWLGGERAQIVSGETARIAEDSAKTVDKGETKRAYKFGGEYVLFTPEEQKSLRDFGPPVIRILGFKHRSGLPAWASVKKSTFIFPSEEDYVGSTRVFAALWRKLLKDDKVGIAWCIVRANAQPLLAALVPSKAPPSEEQQGTAAACVPSGLWICPLPFADDLREVKAPGMMSKSSDELKSRARVVVQQLQLPRGTYNPGKYPNPALQWQYTILKTLALEEEVPDRAEDATEPKSKAIGKRAGGYLQEWHEQLGAETARATASRALKREADDDDDDGDEPARAAKRKKGAAQGRRGQRGRGQDDAGPAAGRGGGQGAGHGGEEDGAGGEDRAVGGEERVEAPRAAAAAAAVAHWAPQVGST